jgi:hypothetical protein
MSKVKLETVKTMSLPGISVEIQELDGLVRSVTVGPYTIEGIYGNGIRIMGPAAPKVEKRWRAEVVVAAGETEPPHGSVVVGDFENEYEASGALAKLVGINVSAKRVREVEVEVD